MKKAGKKAALLLLAAGLVMFGLAALAHAAVGDYYILETKQRFTPDSLLDSANHNTLTQAAQDPNKTIVYEMNAGQYFDYRQLLEVATLAYMQNQSKPYNERIAAIGAAINTAIAVPAGQQGSIRVTLNPADFSAPTQPPAQDLTVSAVSAVSNTKIAVTFSRAVAAAEYGADKFTFDQGLTMGQTAPTLKAGTNSRVVEVTTTAQTAGATYALSYAGTATGKTFTGLAAAAPAAPNITVNTQTGALNGLEAGMEYRVNGGNWTDYNLANPPYFTTGAVVEVRWKVGPGAVTIMVIPALSRAVNAVDAINYQTVEVTLKDAVTTVSAASFTFDGGLSVTGAAIKPNTSNKVIVLTTSAQTAGKVYVLTYAGETWGDLAIIGLAQDASPAPNVTITAANQVLGYNANTMEYRLNGGEWKSDSIPALKAGDVLEVRVKGPPAGAIKRFRISEGAGEPGAGKITDVQFVRYVFKDEEFYAITITCTSDVYYAEINDMPFSYEGKNIYSVNLTGITAGETVAIRVYNKNKVLLEEKVCEVK